MPLARKALDAITRRWFGSGGDVGVQAAAEHRSISSTAQDAVESGSQRADPTRKSRIEW
jgi:hypothetical protein